VRVRVRVRVRVSVRVRIGVSFRVMVMVRVWLPPQQGGEQFHSRPLQDVDTLRPDQ
jgi:hypothetical protein